MRTRMSRVNLNTLICEECVALFPSSTPDPCRQPGFLWHTRVQRDDIYPDKSGIRTASAVFPGCSQVCGNERSYC